MKIFCLNITEMSFCGETLDYKSNFGKDGGGPCEIDIKVYSNGIMCGHMK
jgi:hypothetical protein